VTDSDCINDSLFIDYQIRVRWWCVETWLDILNLKKRTNWIVTCVQDLKTLWRMIKNSN